MRTLPLVFLFPLFAAFLSANTLHIPVDFATIQEAIDAASHGDLLLVSPGTYVENVDFMGKAITVESTDGPEGTVIDGGEPSTPGFGSAVLFHNNESADTVLQGFTLTNGKGVLIEENLNGGGICCISASPTIIHNLIVSNTALFGGGICCHGPGTSPTIKHNIIDHNESQGGGGIYCSASTTPWIEENEIFLNYASICGGGIYSGTDALPIVRRNTIYKNTAEWSGGGINCYKCSPVIDRNCFFENYAGKRGGGVRFNAVYAEITGNLIYNNTAGYGGGVCCGNSLLVNNTIYGNVGLGFGGGATFNSDSTIDITNTIFWNNDAPRGSQICLNATLGPSILRLTYSNVDEGQEEIFIELGSTLIWGAGMLLDEPGFVDPQGQDFHLNFDAACKDAGNPSTPSLPEQDLEGDPRVAYGAVDIGADEYHPHLYCMGDFTPSGFMAGKVVGLPGTWPVGIFLGTAILDPPLAHKWGDFYLEAPWFLIGPLGPLPQQGVLALPAEIPADPSGPYTVYMQALIGDALSNVFALHIR